MSVQQEKKNYQQRTQAQHSNTTSRVGIRSCLRGEIEDTECKIELFSFHLFVRLLQNRQWRRQGGEFEPSSPSDQFELFDKMATTLDLGVFLQIV